MIHIWIKYYSKYLLFLNACHNGIKNFCIYSKITKIKMLKLVVWIFRIEIIIYGPFWWLFRWYTNVSFLGDLKTEFCFYKSRSFQIYFSIQKIIVGRIDCEYFLFKRYGWWWKTVWIIARLRWFLLMRWSASRIFRFTRITKKIYSTKKNDSTPKHFPLCHFDFVFHPQSTNDYNWLNFNKQDCHIYMIFQG